MDKKMAALGALIAILTLSATAQTTVTTSDGTTNTVPVCTGTSTVGNSPISISGSNVGIGTTSPSNALTVVGYQTAYAGDTATFSSNQGSSSSVGNQVNISNTAVVWGLLAGFDGSGASPGNYHGANAAYLINVQGGPLNMGTNNNVNLTINSAGNVGIGTTSPGAVPPSGYRSGTSILEVNGDFVLTHGNGGFITFQDGTEQNRALPIPECFPAATRLNRSM